MQKNLFYISLILLSASLFSCNRHIRYIQKEKGSADSVNVYKVNSEPYRLKPNDVLHIKITTIDPDINNLFKIDEQNNDLTRSQSGGNFFLSGFTVNDTGMVQIPILGVLEAQGKTVTEFRNEVISKTHEYLKEAIVNVKLVSFKVSFLGEIMNTGTQYIYQDNIDILEALSRAGGVTEYADIRNVMVVRQENDERIVYQMDLTRRDILMSEKFYLYPDDIVIVEPIKAKIAQMNIRDYMYFLSAMTSVISTTAIVINLFSNP
jgi:polysaccharide export outer membrane protein